MPLVLGLFKVSDKPYDYSQGCFYTILPNGLPDPLPEQANYYSSGIHMGIYKSKEEAMKEMINDIKIMNGNDCADDNEYYIIDEYIAEEDDIKFRISDPPL